MPDVINVWTGGCIIRSALLPVFSKAYTKTPDLKNLLLDEEVANLLKGKQQGLAKYSGSGRRAWLPGKWFNGSFKLF